MFLEQQRSGLRRYFSSGWLFLLPFALVWWLMKFGAISPGIYVGITGVLLLTTFLAAVFWAVSDRKNISRESVIFLLCVTAIFGVFGPDLEFPQDNWGYLYRTVLSLETIKSLEMGLSINRSAIELLPKSIWISDVWVIATAWAVLIIYLFWRFANIVGITGAWGRAAAISVLFTMGTLGLHSFRHVILGHAALGIIAQFALFTEVIAALQNRKFTRLWLILPLAVILAGNHLQNVVMSILGVVAIGLWAIVTRFGWLRGGGTLLSIALIFWAVFDLFFFNGARDVRINELIAEGVWLSEPGIFKLFGAEGRALLPLGVVGILNLVAAFWLLIRNHVIGWLTMIPVLALCYPPFAKIYASFLDQTGNLIVFNRLFFIVPTTFALIMVLKHLSDWLKCREKTPVLLRRGLIGCAVAVFIVLTAIPQKPFFGKLAHWVNHPQSDLRLVEMAQLIDWVRENKTIKSGDLILSDVTTHYALASEFPSFSPQTERWYAGRFSDVLPEALGSEANFSEATANAKAVLLVRSPLAVSSRPSFISRLFSHSDPLLVKHNLTHSPEWISKMDRLVDSQEWTREEAPPFYFWYAPPVPKK